MIAWNQVPSGHRSREYEWRGPLVRCSCQCRWLSTWARSLADAGMLWAAHIRSLARAAR